MPIEVLMPALSPTMTEGKLAKWLKQEGDLVKSGQVLAEIETDKATMEIEAVDEGTLGRILIPAGTEGVKVNQPIALILEEGESPLPDASPGPGPAASAAPVKPVPPAVPTRAPTKAAPIPSAPPAAGPPMASRGNGAGAHAGDRLVASPLARRMARQANLDLAALKGSGPHGRIVKADIDAALGSGAGRPRPIARAPLPAPVTGGPTPSTLVPHTTMRRVIARRLTEAKQQVPHFYLTIDCEIDALLHLRADLNAKSPESEASEKGAGEKGAGEKGAGAYKLSVNDFVIRASALALRKVPAANASWSEEGTILYGAADISVAVAIPGGLITPIIRNADAKGLAEISNEMKELGRRARDNKLKPEEFQGGTFSISNLGMYGIKEFAAVINPPQGCILAVGAGEQRPVVKGGALAIASVMSCTLSVDHRVVDGVIGAEFLAVFKKLIEDPLTMLL